MRPSILAWDEKKKCGRVGLSWKFYFGALLLFAILVGGCVGPRFIVYSEGHRVGTIEKLSTKGLFMKTTEGELAMRGFGGSQSGKEGQSNGNTWAFTVVDKSIIEEINAIPPGQVVKLHYKEYFFKPIIGHTKYRATRVERVMIAIPTTPPILPPLKH